jgi:sigma-B regulation protein RsbU (phosphoserine phosphatase)
LSEDAHQTPADLPTEDLEDLYENAPCGYLSIRPDGRIFKVNQTLLDWLGFSREQLVGRPLRDMLHIGARIFFETHFAPLLRMQGFFNEVALDLLTRQRVRLPVLVNAKEKRDPEGRHLFTRLTIFNATDRRRYERQLVQAREAAEDAVREFKALHAAEQAAVLDERTRSALREQFIAVLGHDLRNPLGGIMGGAQLLQRMPLDERSKKIASMMESGAVRMAALIDNILDFARGRLSGGLPLKRDTAVMLEPLLRQVVAELQTNWPRRTFEMAFAITEPVDCDSGRIGQLVSNLLGNALTHGAPDQPIRIGALTADGTFQLSVANAGEPIPADALEQLFEPFFRADVGPSQQGLGLGLYIVSEIVRAHDGTIEVSSDASETRFTFRMPLRTEQRSSA